MVRTGFPPILCGCVKTRARVAWEKWVQAHPERERRAQILERKRDRQLFTGQPVVELCAVTIRLPVLMRVRQRHKVLILFHELPRCSPAMSMDRQRFGGAGTR